MSRPVRVRPTSAAALKLRWYANKVGQALHRVTSLTAARNAIYDGFLFKGRKGGGRVSVDVIEVPGRFEGSNQYRGIPDPINGESMLDGIVTSTSPMLDALLPTSAPVLEVSIQERPGKLGAIHAFGDPLPENPFLLYNSFATEFDGGVIFTHLYTDVAPPTDAFGGFVITDQPVWLAVLVRWAGAGPVRSVSFSDAYVQGATGASLYPRDVMLEGAPIPPIRFGARLPVAHYHAGRLSIAIELESAGGGLATVGGLLAVGIHYPEGAAAIEWQNIVGPADLGADLVSDTFAGSEGAFQAAGFDLPAVFAYIDSAAEQPVPVTLVSFRARCRRAVGSSFRIVTGQALLVVSDGVCAITTGFIDSVAGLDAGLPQISADKVHVQKYRDDFFLDAEGRPVRHRRMRLLSRPTTDADISPAAPTTLPVHTDIALLHTEGAAATVNQFQAVLGYGPEESPAGAPVSSGVNGIENIGFSTPVAAGEVWSWGFINGTSATQIGIARITAAGVAAPLAAGIPRSLRLSTYQREVKDEFGTVVMPMGQVATLLDAGLPKIAVKKGRFGVLGFIAAAAYCRFGTFYLASPASRPKYGRIFG